MLHSQMFPNFLFLTLDDQADFAERHSVDALLFYPDAKALRYAFINQDTCELERCNMWNCLYWTPQGRSETAND